jgi:hypothetical protein
MPAVVRRNKQMIKNILIRILLFFVIIGTDIYKFLVDIGSEAVFLICIVSWVALTLLSPSIGVGVLVALILICIIAFVVYVIWSLVWYLIWVWKRTKE